MCCRALSPVCKLSNVKIRGWKERYNDENTSIAHAYDLLNKRWHSPIQSASRITVVPLRTRMSTYRGKTSQMYFGEYVVIFLSAGTVLTKC